jgi:hypothetical protein
MKILDMIQRDPNVFEFILVNHNGPLSDPDGLLGDGMDHGGGFSVHLCGAVCA